MPLRADRSVSRRNRLLAGQPADCLAWLEPRLTPVSFVAGQVLHERGQPIEHVFFLDAGMACIIADTDDSASGVEVGLVGHEGLVGIAAVLDDQPVAFHRVLAQTDGSAQRLTVAAMRDGLGRFPDLRRQCLRYVEASLAQVSMIAACGRRHPLIERCARWILMAQDCIGGPQVALTQEFLAIMLGVRRSGVTIAASALQRAGYIRYTRGRITVIDRPGLESAACDCYRRIAGEFGRLLP